MPPAWLIAKGKMMKFKSIVPYLVLAGTMMPSKTHLGMCNAAIANGETARPKIENVSDMDYTFCPIMSINVYNEEMENKTSQLYLDAKADRLCAEYIDNMIAAQQKLAPLLGKAGYHAAVRRELPGAPVGAHCVYGQYTQLSRALAQLGDTVTIVPRDARSACYAFKSVMRNQYKSPEYAGCISEGKMFPSDSAYNAAFDKFIATRKSATPMSDSLRNVLADKFAKSNFSVEKLSPGSMLIVPRTHGNRYAFHMIMLLGRGRIENGKFIPDDKGQYVYTGHNREKIGYLFDTWDTSNVFASDTRKIARVKYAQELKRIESMPQNELVDFVFAELGGATSELQKVPRHMLVQIARAKYFDSVDLKPSYIAANSFAMAGLMRSGYLLAMRQHTM